MIFAGREIRAARDNVLRYCGLPWSGGEGEVWAYPYYDAIVTTPDLVEPIDVVATAALMPKLTPHDLTWFSEKRSELEQWLQVVPDIHLANASIDEVALLDELRSIADTGVTLSLLSKVLHRKRPGIIPILDRAPLDWYRRQLDGRGAAAWPQYIRLLAGDLQRNATTLEKISQDVPLTPLRIADIAIWMESRKI